MNNITSENWAMLPYNLKVHTLSFSDIETLKNVRLVSKNYRKLAREAALKLQERLLPKSFNILIGNSKLYLEEPFCGNTCKISLKINVTNAKLNLSKLETIAGCFVSYTLTLSEGKPVKLSKETMGLDSNNVYQSDQTPSEVNTFFQKVQDSLSKASIDGEIIHLTGLNEYLSLPSMIRW